MRNNAVCTIASLNYFAQVKSLAESVHKNNNDIDFYVLLVDDIDVNMQDLDRDLKDSSFIKIIKIPELQITDWISMAFKYNLVEFNTALKPYFLEFLFQKYNYTNLIYLDPDILVFHNFNDLYNIMEDYSIIITPHIIEDIEGNYFDISNFLIYGIYNLGFIALRNDQNGIKLLKWWKEKLRDKCLKKPNEGLAWDQKWIDFAPALFDSVYILKDPGYNAAIWNIVGRRIDKIQNIFYVNSNYKLIFYHFSHYRLNDNDYIMNIDKDKQVKLSDRPDLVELYTIYYNNVKKMGYDFYNNLEYKYNYFDNHIKIENYYRRIYFTIKDKYNYPNPFDTSNDTSFYNYLQINKLIREELVSSR